MAKRLVICVHYMYLDQEYMFLLLIATLLIKGTGEVFKRSARLTKVPLLAELCD